MQAIQEENQADDDQHDHPVRETIQEGKISSSFSQKKYFSI
jgi:hypothetical protein